MDIENLHLEFLILGESWDGVARFANVIGIRRSGSVPMHLLTRQCWNLAEFPAANGCYTVEQYLSDLLSRHKRLDEEQVLNINRMYGNCADYLHSIPAVILK
jgi:hypothetical protein